MLAEKIFSHDVLNDLTRQRVPSLQNEKMFEIFERQLNGNITIFHIVDKRIYPLPVSLVLVQQSFELSISEIHIYKASI
jgi:hypothetical protein